MELWGKFWYLASRALSSRYFFLHFNVNLWPKRRRCSVPLKSLRLIAAPLAFPSISLRLWRVLFLLAKKWCFQKQAWNLKTCYVLHCRRMQRCWALWTLSGWHKYIFIISQLQKVQIIHVQVLKGEKCTAYHILMTGSICNHYKKVMSSRCNGFSWKNTSNLKRVVAFSLLLGVKFAPLIMISIEINLKDGDSQIGGWLKTGSLPTSLLLTSRFMSGTFDRR